MVEIIQGKIDKYYKGLKNNPQNDWDYAGQ